MAIVLVALVTLGVLAVLRLNPARAAGSSTATTVTAVPAADFAVLGVAARSCPALTPSRLAAQVMVSTAFGNRPPSVGGGIAGFTPVQWQRWAPWPGAKVTDRRASIIALAHSTCQSVGQLRRAGVAGDPWKTAVAAAQAGIPAVIGARGVPAGSRAFVERVAAYAAAYAAQPQFGGLVAGSSTPSRPVPTAGSAPSRTVAGPTSTPTVRPSTTGPSSVPTTAASATAAPTPPPTQTKSASPVATQGSQAAGIALNRAYQLYSRFEDQVWSPARGLPAAGPADVELWPNTHAANQYWRVVPAPTPGYVIFVNAVSGKAVGVKENPLYDYAGLEETPLVPSDLKQQWKLSDAGGGEFWIINRNSGKAIDMWGDDLGSPSGTGLEQFSLQLDAKDQRWTLVPSE